ncbi:MAG: N-acetylmuramic acid 6-phosphate etherase [Elusimicrobia bacterium]|nr:N-acetylmuramic acid 6-phosphate etherase [Elusimicrobiota bacterium]
MSSSRSGIYRALATEQPHPTLRDLDLQRPLDLIRRINREDRRVAPAVGREAGRLARAVEIVSSALRAGGKLIFVGAGTSGRLGVLEAAECPPTFGTPPRMIQAVMAGGDRCVFRSKEGAEDDAQDGARRVLRRVRAGDVVVGIAASGVTPFVRGALRAARRRGCRTVLVTSDAWPGIGDAEVVISPRVGPEVLAGSTRLKSGTAAKMVLNLLTTVSMVRLGKVYDRWMVDLRPTSRKLRLRAVRIVSDLGGVSPAAAQGLLRDCGGSVKLAIVVARLFARRGSSRRRPRAAQIRRAREILAVAQGSLRRALKSAAWEDSSR